MINIRNDGLPLFMTFNLMSYPEFQSLAALTNEERKFYYGKYSNLKAKVYGSLQKHEQQQFDRIVDELSQVAPESQPAYRKDLISFFDQYTQRRNKPYNFIQDIGK